MSYLFLLTVFLNELDVSHKASFVQHNCHNTILSENFNMNLKKLYLGNKIYMN